jgi:hypothetical protein
MSPAAEKEEIATSQSLGSCGIPLAVDYNKDSKLVPEGESRMTTP